MTYLKGEVTVIHDWTKIDFANYVYSRVMFTRTFGTVVINGNTITKIVGVTLDIVVDPHTTIIDDPFTVLLGNPKSVFSEYENEVSHLSMYIAGDTSNEQIDCGTDASLQSITGSFTASIWAKPEFHSPAIDGYMLDNYFRGRGWVLMLNEPDRKWTLRLGCKPSPGSVFHDCDSLAGVVEADVWQHIVGVWDNATKLGKIYINGSLNNTTDLSMQLFNTLEASTSTFLIGSGGATSNEFEGLINNARVWGVALTDAEVLQVFENGVTYNIDGLPNSVNWPQEASLISWWKLGDDANWDGSRWQVPDQIGVNDGEGSGSLDFPARRLDAPTKNI